MGAKGNLLGQRFGRLLVIEELPGMDKQGCVVWNCLCDCGGNNQLSTRTLNRRIVNSCGCLKSELNRERTKLHGLSGTKMYNVYLAMRRRCYVETDWAFQFYGEKGILVCDRWLESEGRGFLNFIEDMGEKPEESYSLDRIDPLGNYSPENCRWASKRMQAINQDIRTTNTSGRTGVSFDKKAKKWRAYIRNNGKTLLLGFFETLEEACAVRADAELKYYGFVKK